MVLTNQLINLVNVKNHEEDFFKLCVLLKKSELYNWLMAGTSVYVSSGSAWLHVGGTSTAQQTRQTT